MYFASELEQICQIMTVEAIEEDVPRLERKSSSQRMINVARTIGITKGLANDATET